MSNNSCSINPGRKIICIKSWNYSTLKWGLLINTTVWWMIVINCLYLLMLVFSFWYVVQLVCAVHGAIASVSNPQFISPSQTIRVEVGQTIRLPCDIKNLGNFSVHFSIFLSCYDHIAGMIVVFVHYTLYIISCLCLKLILLYACLENVA